LNDIKYFLPDSHATSNPVISDGVKTD